jgi:hypothetical protein
MNISGLDANTAYYAQPYMTAEHAGFDPLTVYGGAAAFNTNPDIVSAQCHSGDTEAEAVISAEFSGGTLEIVSVKIYYDTSDNEIDDESPTLVELELDGADFDIDGFEDYLISGLTPYETYNFRISIENSAGGTAQYDFQFLAKDLMIRADVPVKMIFAAFTSGGGAVESPVYYIKNRSAYSLDITVDAVSAVTAGGLNLTDDPQVRDDISLKFTGSGSTPTFGTGFLTEGTNLGQYMGQIPAGKITPQSAFFKIDGRYVPPFSAAAKEVRFDVSFKMELDA